MLQSAIAEIDQARTAAERERRRRAAHRAELRRAEGYALQVEDVLELGGCVPEALLTEVRRFVRRRSRRLAGRINGAAGPADVLDVLFDLMERIHPVRAAA